jgi:hypothetical protein
VAGGEGYLSVSDRSLRLGLGSGSAVSKVVIRWPSGETQTLENLAAGVWKVRHGSAPAPQ